MGFDLPCNANFGEMFGCQCGSAASTSYLRTKHLCGCRLEVEKSRGLVPLGQGVQHDHKKVREARHRLDGKSAVAQSSFLLQLEQGRQRGTQLGCFVSGSELVNVGKPIHLPAISSYRSLLGKDKRSESWQSLGSPPVLARQGVVQHLHADGSGGQEVATFQDDGLRPVNRSTTTSSQLVPAGRRISFWRTRSGEFSQLTEQSRELVEASWRPNTEATYSSSWNKWTAWCRVQGVSTYSPCITDVMNFLSSLFKDGKEYRTINCARSMLSSTLLPIDNFPVGKHPMVTRLLKGVFNVRPPVKILFPTWSVKQVLNTLATWAPASSLDLKTLTFKCLMLLALVTGKRASSLSMLSCKSGYMQIGESTVVLQPLGLEKNTRPGHTGGPIVIEAYNRSPEICPVFYVKAYLKRTASLRSSDSVFVTVNKPHKQASPTTICRWLKSVISLSGQEGSGGSTRSVSTSTAVGRGVTIDSIVKAGDWARSRTFRQHYYKPVPVNDLQNSLLTI